MPTSAHDSEILHFTDGFLSLRWGHETLKVRASFTPKGDGGSFTGTVDDGPVDVLAQSVTVESPDLIRAEVRFAAEPEARFDLGD